LGNRKALSPSARECLCDGIELREARRAERRTQSRLPVRLLRASPFQGAFDDVPPPAPRRETGILLNIGHPHTLARSDLARIRLDLARQHLEQGGFAAAVRADKANPVPVVDCERDVPEESRCAEP